MEGKFLITADATTASALIKCGFQKMETGNKNIYTFLNNASIKFSESVDINKVKPTNILTF